MVPCQHWRACGVTGGGCCSIDAYHKPSIGVCLTQCKKYNGPPRGDIGRRYLMTELSLRQLPQHQKVRHAQVLVNALPTTAYIGDHIAKGLSKLGVKSCPGCEKRKQILNGAHRSVRKLVGLHA